MPRKARTSAPQQNQRQRLVEEYCSIAREVEDFKPRTLRYEKLRTLILGWYPEIPPEDEITAAGLTADVLISARDRVRSVTLEGRQKLYKLWGSKDFVAKCNILLKSLPDPKDEARLYTIEALSGPRHLRVVSKAAAAD